MNQRQSKSGQAAVEYILVFIALLGVVSALAFFLSAARQSSVRTVELVSSEYP